MLKPHIGFREDVFYEPSRLAIPDLRNPLVAAIGAILPLLIAFTTPISFMVEAVAIASLVFLALLGVVGAKIGRANLLKAAIRVTLWGALAMAVTAVIGAVLGAQI